MEIDEEKDDEIDFDKISKVLKYRKRHKEPYEDLIESNGFLNLQYPVVHVYHSLDLNARDFELACKNLICK
jgi:hypothetical protein